MGAFRNRPKRGNENGALSGAGWPTSGGGGGQGGGGGGGGGGQGGGGHGGGGYDGPWAAVVDPPSVTGNPPDSGGGEHYSPNGEGGGGAGGGGGQGGNPPGFTYSADLERYLSGLQEQGDSATAAAAQQRAELFNRYFDPNNAFSNQAMLQRQLHQAHAENALGMGASGHLYSGALEALDAETAFGGQQAEDALLREYADRSGSVDSALLGATTGLTGKAEDAIWQYAAAMAADSSDTPIERQNKKKHKKKDK